MPSSTYASASEHSQIEITNNTLQFSNKPEHWLVGQVRNGNMHHMDTEYYIGPRPSPKKDRKLVRVFKKAFKHRG